MKFIPLILALFFLVSCSGTANLSEPSQNEKSLNAFQPSGEIILEVTSNFESDLAWIKGEILNFRLYSDGLVEFDDIPLESPDGKQARTEEVRDRKRIKISESTQAEIKNILLSREFQRLKNKYEKIESSCDAVPEVEIKAANKIIEIRWCDNLTQPKHSPDFPEILSKLLRKNREIRNAALGKEGFAP